MIAVLKHGTTLAQREHLVQWLKDMKQRLQFMAV